MNRKESEEVFMDVIRSGFRMRQMQEISSPEGFEVFMASPWFTEEEKDHVVFNIEQIRSLAEINPYHIFGC
jgi:hypothetical protein